jgi:hypothetical protein
MVWTGEDEVLGENTGPVLLRPQPKPTWISLGSNQILRGAKPASNQTQYGDSRKLHTWCQKVHVMDPAASAPRGRICISYCVLWLESGSTSCLSKTNVTFL